MSASADLAPIAERRPSQARKPSVAETRPSPQHRPSRPSISGNPAMFRKKSSVQEPPGPSLIGLLASKRFAKRLSTRYSTTNRKSSGSKSNPSRAPEPRLEPTYRMEPKHKFSEGKVIDCIEDVVQPRLKTFHYSPKMGALMGRVISEEVKQSVKSLCFDRYKIVVSVTIGQKIGQGVHCSSRCAWDEKKDNHATHTMEGEDFFCTVNVFGVYLD